MFFRRISILFIGALLSCISVVQAQEGSLPPASVYGQGVRSYRATVVGFLKETDYSNAFQICKNNSSDNNESLAYFQTHMDEDSEREGEKGLYIRDVLNKQVIFSGKFREVTEHGRVVKITCLGYTIKFTPMQIAQEKKQAEVEEEKRKKLSRAVSVGYLDLTHFPEDFEGDIWVCSYCSEGSMDQDSHGKQDRYGINNRTLFTGLDKKDLQYRAWKKVRVRAVFTNPDNRECSTIEIYPVSDDTEVSLTEHK